MSYTLSGARADGVEEVMMGPTHDLIREVHAARFARLSATRARRRRETATAARTGPTPATATPSTGAQMDTDSAIARFEAAVSAQVAAAGDPALEAAARSLLAALGPASRQLALDLAEQAAVEVAAQLPDHEVDVVVRAGEPALAVREPRQRPAPAEEDYEARITLRLPPTLKRLVEESAGSTGDSVNAWVVKTLSSVADRPGRRSRSLRGTVRT